MKLQDFSILKEDDEHYHVEHPSGRKLMVKKAGLNPSAHKMIQKFAGGGEVELKLPELGSQFNGQVQAPTLEGGTPLPEPSALENMMARGQAAGDAEMARYAPPTPKDNSPTPGTPEFSLNQRQPAVQAPPMNPMQQASLGTDKSLQAQEAANTAIGSAQANQGAETASAIKGVESQIAKLPTVEDLNKKYAEADAALSKDYQDKKIDPERYWNHKTTGQKIVSGIAMVLSGFGAGVAGQPNLALQHLNSAIENDIESQKNDQSKAMNLWKMNREKMKTDVEANLATRNQLYTGLKYKIDLAAANSISPIAKANAMKANAVIDHEIAQNRFKLSLMQGGDVDPALKIPYLVPEHQQKEVAAEIKRAQDTHNITKDIMQAYDEASTDLRPVSGGRWKNALPFTESAYQNKLEALLMTTVQDLEGTVKQSAMENIKKNMLPHTFNSDEEVKVRRDALSKYLAGKASAPLAKSHGIDLQQYPSTQTANTNPITYKGGVPYQKSADGKYMVPVK